MLEMICKIPENIGWVMVGAVGMLCVVVLVKLGKVIAEMIKYRIEENKFWKVHHYYGDDDEIEE
jgi:hypothetical protein